MDDRTGYGHAESKLPEPPTRNGPRWICWWCKHMNPGSAWDCETCGVDAPDLEEVVGGGR